MKRPAYSDRRAPNITFEWDAPNVAPLTCALGETAEFVMKQRLLFVSYSRHDKEIIRQLCSLLRISGAEVFRDEESIQPGEKWRAVLSSSIENSDYMLVFWSTNSASSEAVREEFMSAINLDKPVVPILLDNTPLVPALRQFQWIDFRIFGSANPFSDASNPYVPNWIPIGGPLGSEDEDLLKSFNVTLSLMEHWKVIALAGVLEKLGIVE